ncbi:1-deoxy-D-xylulose-5-phosphate synthase [Vibrio sp. Makdt]|uniref:1-deoxy-D-xylulose-5-phosphate synthase n=1 Tax=Vibrio sp. Makdt TaxID=2998828 RepID=UPI0022CD43D8|nr:1-deoxy-D-xylulose-5-phosphate synthase [Vibrio sp. Makdt]MDA0154498.1 1-deoxy-D-xylulose-5-phosphate synthase [Vibrio sp. Makdt]
MKGLLPTECPTTPLLDIIENPTDIRELKRSDLKKLSHEMRCYMSYVLGKTGGHFGSSLGVVELTVALHYVFNTPDDKLVWDVGHQSLPHKILTGRKRKILTYRQINGLSAFPKRTESKFDTFGVGHSSTSIGAALGMATAFKLKGANNHSVAIIGDGALTAGMAFEALNHCSELDVKNFIVILNDNEMSISNNVGGLSKHFGKVLSSELYNSIRSAGKKILSSNNPATKIAQHVEEHTKGLFVPSVMFEELGFNYIGPVDGNDIDSVVNALNSCKKFDGPHFLHLKTVKGKGVYEAENNPVKYHTVNKIEPDMNVIKALTFSNVFGKWSCKTASQDSRLAAITPAMKEGSDLIQFAQLYPKRFFDVGIAEQHAVTFAAGIACEGLKPVVAIYSTFLQRAYDQILHDVCIQSLDVLLAIDRAGLVGADGPTHHGLYDIPILRCIPQLVIMTPSGAKETYRLLNTGYHHKGPAAVRYPKGSTPDDLTNIDDLTPIPLGTAAMLREGKKVAILAFGPILHNAKKSADELDATLVDMRFVKPLDSDLLKKLVASHELIVTVEDSCVKGGAGSAVSEFMASENLKTNLLHIAVPDKFIEHGTNQELYRDLMLDENSILDTIKKYMHTLNLQEPGV